MGALSGRADYEQHIAAMHRPAHGRRTAERWAAHLLPHLRPEMRLLDLGCGPGSITRGLDASTVGVDIAPLPIEGVPVASADAAALPFPDETFDALFSNALLQHVPDALAVLREARRVARPGAVIAVGDADWGGALFHPHDPLLDRSWEIRAAMRAGGDVHVGRTLRALLTAAGFERAELSVTGNGAGTSDAVRAMAFGESGWFEAPAVVAYVTEVGASNPDEMSSIADAWRRWAAHPGASAATYWFTAVAWAPA